MDKIGGALEMGRITNLGNDDDDVTREPHFLAARSETLVTRRVRVVRDENTSLVAGPSRGSPEYPCARIENAIALIIHVPIQQDLNISRSAPSLTNFLSIQSTASIPLCVVTHRWSYSHSIRNDGAMGA